MFKKLREKISSWSKKVSEEAETQETEKSAEEQEEAEEEKQLQKETQKKPEKKEISETEEPTEEQEEVEEEKEISETEEKTEIQKEPEQETQKQEEIPEKISDKNSKEIEKQVEVPRKFNIGTQKFEPDLEKLEEKTKELEEETETKAEKEPLAEISESSEYEETEEKPEKKKGFFSRLTSGGKVKISEKDFDQYADELEMILLENNVALETTEKILEELKEKITQEEIPKKQLETKIREALKETIKDSLSEPFNIEEKIKEKSDSETEKEPYVILFCGINGTGKTTTIAKIANRLKQKNISSIIAAGDTFRAASVEQLQKHGQTLGINVISSSYGADPASVGFDAINNAKKKNIDCVLIDTAGRMHTDKNLIKQIEKISRVCKPDLKVFVGESITGNDSIEQIKSFDQAIGIDSIILTKADIDEKGGTALSLGHIIKKPILYLGIGQNYSDIEPFDKDRFIEKLGL